MCFSMYSDMSRRTIACSSSNRNSASARASSVLPTPVGPRNRNEPIGRRGSPRPARERRTALATSSSASSWPTTRSRRRSSMWSSFCISPSSRRETGMPVHLATTSATSSASTSSLSIFCVVWSWASLSFSAASCFSRLGQRPVLQLGGLARGRPGAVASSTSVRVFSICSLISRIFWIAAFSCCQWAFMPAERSLSSAISRSTFARRSFEALSFSFFSAWRSISSWISLRSTSSISVGSESISMRRREAASSTRSIALSGRKRSAM